jgi:aminoglycoside/choline kinase family phosphotransferase
MDTEIDKKLYDTVERLLSESKLTPPLSLKSLKMMTPDASMRRYYRATVVEIPPANPSEKISAPNLQKTLVVMKFLSVSNPEAGGGENVAADEACVILSNFFQEKEIAVPQLFIDARSEGILIIEDIGDRTLGEILSNSQTSDILTYYRATIDQLLAIQSIPRQELFIFNRRFAAAQYLSEMQEFIDYSLNPLGGMTQSVTEAFSELSGELDSLPIALAHRDYHSWNIMIDEQGRVRVIDFQDALMAPRCYDIVALLNDRCTDQLLGKENYQTLLRYFYQQIDFKNDFFQEYDRVLLQRDLKVVGRFSKLSKERGLTHYEQWIPGTLQRIGCTLKRLSSSNPVYQNLLETLLPTYPEIDAGSQQRIEFLEGA